MESTMHPLPDPPPPAPILRLNADIVLEVFKLLQDDIRHILSLRQTCKEISSWTRMRQCWHSALLHLARHVPVPFHDRVRVPSMDATQMEALVIRLIRLDRNWNCPVPIPLRVQTIPSPVSGDFSGHFTNLKHFAGGRFLLCGSEEHDAPIFCLDLEDPEARICELGRWASTDVPWTMPSLRDFFGRYRRFGDSEITVTGLFNVQGAAGSTTVSRTHSSIGIWRFDPQTWPPNPTVLPSLNFSARLEYMDINSGLIACGRMGQVRVIDYEPSSVTRFQQGVFYPQLHNTARVSELRMLSSQILVLTSRAITLFPHPQLHATNDLEDTAACLSAVSALWSWPLDENRIGPFRRFSCPDYNTLANNDDPLHFNVHQLFFYLTNQHLFAIFPRDPPSAEVEIARLAAKGISLPENLQNTARVLLGPSGKRGVWAYSSGTSQVAIQLVDFWGQDYSAQLWAESFHTFSDPPEVNMQDNYGLVAGLAPGSQVLTFDEDSGIVVLGTTGALVVYKF